MMASAILGAAATIPSPVQPFAAAGAVVANSVGGFLSSIGSVLTGQTDTDRARLARAASYLAGAQAGDVTSVRLALWTSTKVGAAAEKTLYQNLLANIRNNYPQVYAQAVALGGLPDHEDGQVGLQELLSNRIPFAQRGAGHPTGDGHYNNTDPATLAIVAALANLGPTAAAPAPGGTPAPAAAAPLKAGVPTWLILALAAGIAVALVAGHHPAKP